VYAVHNKLSEEMYTVHKDTMKTAKKSGWRFAGHFSTGTLRRALLEAGIALAREGGPNAVVLREATRRALSSGSSEKQDLGGLNCLRRDSLDERKDITGCRKTNALYQGTGLAGPCQVLLMRTLAPDVLLSCAVRTFFAAL
jgi:hypothetical protein